MVRRERYRRAMPVHDRWKCYRGVLRGCRERKRESAAGWTVPHIQGNRMKKKKKYVIIDQKELVNNDKIL